MSLENATKISELVATNPPGTDPVSQGDDHIRMIKNVLQQDAYSKSADQVGLRNILINGNMRINQRGVTIAAAANGAYGPDRWKKVDASNMTQIVEEFNYRPSTVYTLSGTGVTTQQITSPASGNWTIPNVPITATNIQLEPGSIATPFEQRPIGLELSLCQRYYEKSYDLGVVPGAVSGNGSTVICCSADSVGKITVPISFRVTKRANPSIAGYSETSGAINTWDYQTSAASGPIAFDALSKGDAGFNAYLSAVSAWQAAVLVRGHWTADAEL